MSFEKTQTIALERARLSQPAPNTHCALQSCKKKLPDLYGFVLWSDHPEDERYCSKHCANIQFNRALMGKGAG